MKFSLQKRYKKEDPLILSFNFHSSYYIDLESENSCSGPVSSVRSPDFEEDLRLSLTAGLAESLTSAVSGQVSSLLGNVTASQTHPRLVQ